MKKLIYFLYEERMSVIMRDKYFVNCIHMMNYWNGILPPGGAHFSRKRLDSARFDILHGKYFSLCSIETLVRNQCKLNSLFSFDDKDNAHNICWDEKYRSIQKYTPQLIRDGKS